LRASDAVTCFMCTTYNMAAVPANTSDSMRLQLTGSPEIPPA